MQSRTAAILQNRPPKGYRRVMCRQAIGLLSLSIALGCGSEPRRIITIEARVSDDGSVTPFRELGRVSADRVVRVEDVSFSLDERGPTQAVSFGPGCLPFQLDSSAVTTAFNEPVRVGSSRSLYQRERGIPPVPRLVPFISPAFEFLELDNPLVSNLPLVPSQLTSTERSRLVDGLVTLETSDPDTLRFDCTIRDVSRSALSISVEGAAIARIGNENAAACTVADERACHRTVQSLASRTPLFIELLDGAQATLDTVVISGCVEEPGRREIQNGVLRTLVGPGRCVVSLGEDVWRIALDIVGDSAEPLVARADQSVIGLQQVATSDWLVPCSIQRATFALLEAESEAPASVSVIGMGCESASDVSVRAMRPNPCGNEIVACRVTPRGVDPSVTLNLGDSVLPVRLEFQGDTLTCQSEDEQSIGPCQSERDGTVVPFDSVPVARDETVRLVALANEANFSCAAAPGGRTGDGFPFVDLIMNVSRGCAVVPPPEPEGLDVLFYMGSGFGTVTVRDASGERSCGEANERWCPFTVSGLAQVEFDGVVGYSRFVQTGESLPPMDGDRPPPATRTADCTSLTGGVMPNVFELDPERVRQAEPGAGTLRLECAPQFECEEYTGLAPVTVKLESTANEDMSFAFELTECPNYECSAVIETVPEGTYTLSMDLSAHPGARLLDSSAAFPDSIPLSPTALFGPFGLEAATPYEVPLDVTAEPQNLLMDIQTCIPGQAASSESSLQLGLNLQ